MAFWDKKNTEIDELIKLCKEQKNNKYNEIIVFLEKIKKDEKENFFGTNELLVKFIYQTIRAMINGNDLDFNEHLKDAKSAYSFMLPYGTKTKEKDKLDELFLKLYEQDGVFSKMYFKNEIYALFENKEDYYEIMSLIVELPNYLENQEFIYKFMIEAKKFYILDTTYKAALIDFINASKVASSMDNLIKDKLEIARKMAGVYDVSEKTLARVDRKINGANSTITKLSKLLDMVPEQMKLLDEVLKTSVVKIENTTNEQLSLLRHEVTNCLTEIKIEYQKLWQMISKDATLKKDEIIREVLLTLEGQMKHLETLSMQIANKTSIELERVRNEGSAAVLRLDEYVKNHPDLLKVAESMQGSKEFMDNLAKITNQMQSTGVSPVIIPSIHQINDKVNYFFDDRIPFKEREQELDRRMRANEEKGIIYHEKTKTIIKFLMEKDCPYLYGPSGSGKSHVVGLISELLDIPFIDIGYIIEEHDLVGYKDLNNNFSRTNFAECYEKGYIAFCDELDNGNPRATIKLNNFTRNKQYCFPGGVTIKRHPNFRIIGAGNTSGNGANRAYNARGKLDESVKQRLIEIPFNYDERIDRNLLVNYPDWLDFILKFRKAIETYYKGQESMLTGTVTHRDVSDIKDYLDNQSFSIDEILYYQFIESKEGEYLKFLIQELKKIYEKEISAGSEICKQFIKNCDEVIKRGR